MKKLASHTFTFLGAFVLCLTMAAQAQSSATIKVSVPFDFKIGTQTFPSGKYFLEQPMQNFVVLRDSDSHVVASAFTHGADGPRSEGPKLRFDVENGTHVLTEFWHESEPGVQRLYWSRYDRGRAQQSVAEGSNSPAGAHAR